MIFLNFSLPRWERESQTEPRASIWPPSPHSPTAVDPTHMPAPGPGQGQFCVHLPAAEGASDERDMWDQEGTGPGHYLLPPLPWVPRGEPTCNGPTLKDYRDPVGKPRGVYLSWPPRCRLTRSPEDTDGGLRTAPPTPLLPSLYPSPPTRREVQGKTPNQGLFPENHPSRIPPHPLLSWKLPK